jgi:predicted Zn finger-like uncharacterized protein
MYTRCPNCETTFRLGAEDLRRAHGKVRCGDCSNVFNAIEFLAEDAEDTDDSLPVLTSGPAIISSADNPHRDEAMFEPANETEAPETLEQPENEQSENASYELEIKAYDEKTGQAWSPLETSTWDSEHIPDVTLIDDSLTDDEDSRDSTAEAAPSFKAEQPVWQTDASEDESESNGSNDDDNAIPELETSHDVSMLTQETYTAQAEEPVTTSYDTDYDTEGGLPGFYSDESPFEAEDNAATEEAVASTPAWQADEADNAYEDEHTPAASDEATDPAEDTDEAPEDAPEENKDPLTAETENPVDDGLQEFDGTVWERIPGVGAAEEQRDTQSDLEAPFDADQLADGLSYTGTGFLAIDPEVIAEPRYEADEDNAAESPEATDTADEAELSPSGDNELGFNVPENKWSSFFGNEPVPTAPPTSAEADEGNEATASFEDEPAYEAAEDAASEDISAEDEVEFTISDEDTEEDNGASEDDSFSEALTEAEQKLDGTLTVPVLIEVDDPPALAEDEAEFSISDEGTEEDNDASEDDSFSEALTEAEQKLDGALTGPVVIEVDDPPALAEDEHEDPQAADDLVAEMAAAFGDSSEPVDSSADITGTDDAPETDDGHEESSVEDDEYDDEPSEESATPHWSEMDSIEEVVLSTGEFGASEIASSMAELQNNSESTEISDKDGWRPEHWQPEGEEQDANATAWKSAYAATRESKYSKLWFVAIILLIIGFSTQLLHYNRDKLAASPSYGEMTRNIYNTLGLDLYPNWGMDNYEIRGSEAITGESGQDVLDIRTQIASIGKLAVGLPQLRVVLRDRWSNSVAARTFTPEEYTDNEPLPADGMLQPNQAVAAHIAIVDPGSGTQGYELELCLPRRDTGLECTGRPFK